MSFFHKFDPRPFDSEAEGFIYRSTTNPNYLEKSSKQAHLIRSGSFFVDCVPLFGIDDVGAATLSLVATMVDAYQYARDPNGFDGLGFFETVGAGLAGAVMVSLPFVEYARPWRDLEQDARIFGSTLIRNAFFGGAPSRIFLRKDRDGFPLDPTRQKLSPR